MREQEKKINRTKMLYKEYQTAYEFGKYKTVRSFENAIRNGIIAMDMANDKQEQLAKKVENVK